MTPPPAGFEERVGAVFDGTATPAEREAFCEELLRSPELLERYVEQGEVHAALLVIAEAGQGADGERRSEVGGRRTAGGWWRRGWWKVAAAAAVVAATVWVARRSEELGIRSSEETFALGSLASDLRSPAIGPVALVREAGAAGLELPSRLPGTVRLEKGQATVRLGSGVALTLLGPLELVVRDAMRVRLERGRLLAKVPPVASGFTVQTRELEIWDIGTVFGVSAEEGRSDVFVFRGSVQVSEASGEPVDLCGAGEGVRASEGTRPMKVAADWPEAARLLASVRGDAALDDPQAAFDVLGEVADLWTKRYLPKQAQPPLTSAERRRIAKTSALQRWPVRTVSISQQQEEKIMTNTIRAITGALVIGTTGLAGTDGIWAVDGTGFYNWADTANWVNGQVAEGQDAIADFTAANPAVLDVNLGGTTRTVGHLFFGDTDVGPNQQWRLINGTVNFSVSSGISTVDVSNVSDGVYFYTNMIATGSIRKTGDKYLIFKNMPASAIDVAEGVVQFSPTEHNVEMVNSISGAGDVSFGRTSTGRCRYLATFPGTLSYTGRTIVEWSGGGYNQSPYYQSALWLEKQNVLPSTTILEMRSGNFFLRYNSTSGTTVGGITGNVGTYISTADSNIQKLTINVAEGASYDFAGTIGRLADSSTRNNYAITKTGPGTQIFSGRNTFTGGVSVVQGTLLVNNIEGSGTGSHGAASVAAGATLGGTGFVFNGQAAIGAGGILAPGNPGVVGTLTFSNLTLSAGSVINWKCGPLGQDLVRVLGDVTLPSVATVMVSRLTGDDYPGTGAVLLHDGTNNGATDLSGWTVLVEGSSTPVSCRYDAGLKAVIVTLDDYLPADGVWGVGGGNSSSVAYWTNAANWVGGVIPIGSGSTADFTAVDVANMRVSLDGMTRVIGNMLLGDTVASEGDFWAFENGGLTFQTPVGKPSVQVGDVNGGVTFGTNLIAQGVFRKTGAGLLRIKSMSPAAIEVAEGAIEISPDSINEEMVNAISGSGTVRFGNPDTGGRVRIIATYPGALSYTGRTVINWQSYPGSISRWHMGSLWIEKDDVLPHATVVELQSGNLFTTRIPSGNGQTIAGLAGNPGTFVSTDLNQGGVQRWTINVAEGACYEFAGIIGMNDYAPNVRNRIRVTKTGPGMQIFSGANNFTESLTVSGGTLLINNTTGSGTGTNNIVTVASGATLGGTGTSLSTNVTFAAGAVIAPGTTNAVGTLAFGGDVTFGEGVTYVASYTAAGASSVSVAGTVTLPESLTVALNPLADDLPQPKVITLFAAGAVAGAEDLSGWQVTGSGGGRYGLTLGPNGVTAALPPKGTMIRLK